MTKSKSWKTSVVHSKFWNVLMHDVYGPRKGGAVIFIDAENARRGIAKTSGQCAFAKLLGRAFNYDVKKKDLTLSGKQYLKRARQGDHFRSSQPTVLGIDEFVGAGTGDKRRSMSNENLLLAAAWQMLRTKRVVTLATLPDWNEADIRMQKYADYRLWCQERPIGFVKPYKVKVPFHSGGGPSVYLEGLGKGPKTERITFPNMEAQNDPLYDYISKQKNDVLGTDNFDANELLADEGDGEDSPLDRKEVEKEFLTEMSIRMNKPWTDQYGMSYDAIEQALDEERKSSWIGERVREWKGGKHRDMVPVPGDEPTDAIA